MTDEAHRISDAVQQGTDTHKKKGPIIVVMAGSNIITTTTKLPYPSPALCLCRRPSPMTKKEEIIIVQSLSDQPTPRPQI